MKPTGVFMVFLGGVLAQLGYTMKDRSISITVMLCGIVVTLVGAYLLLVE